MSDPLRIDKVSFGGGAMGALASLACLLILLSVPGLNWFLVAGLIVGVAFGVTLIVLRHQ